MLILPEWAGIGSLVLAVRMRVLVNECLVFCVGERMLGFAAAPDVNNARMGWSWQSGPVYW